MKIELTKHHGLGNDFLVLFDPVIDDLASDDLARLAQRLCHRRSGVGADGLLIGRAVEGYDGSMRLYNADGSLAEMSGNGIRCFAQAVARRSGSLAEQIIITDAGERVITLAATEDPHTIEATVDMGPVEPLPVPHGWRQLGCHPDRPVLHLSVGNPHSVVGVEDVHLVDLLALGEQLPNINLEIIEAGPEIHAITMRVHERGAGITDACGTGACASAWAAAAWGLVPASEREILVHMDGGDVRVRLDEPAAGRVTLVGPAVYVASITVDIGCQP